MNDKLFFRGIICAAAGFVLAQLGPVIGGTPHREPWYIVIILCGLLGGWFGYTISAFWVGDSRRPVKDKARALPMPNAWQDEVATTYYPKTPVIIDSSLWTG